MRRREFIALVGGAVTLPLAAHAQQTDQVRRVGVLMNVAPEHPEGQPFVSAFRQALQRLGWTEGRNIRIDIRWGENDVERDRRYAAELVALTPDVVLAAGTLSVTALQRVSRTLPIVFVEVSDPVGAGLVERLDRPGGSTTGFMIFEYSLSAKWIELLKQVTPSHPMTKQAKRALYPPFWVRWLRTWADKNLPEQANTRQRSDTP